MLKQSWVGEVDQGDIFEWHNNVFWWSELGYSQTLRLLWKKMNLQVHIKVYEIFMDLF